MNIFQTATHKNCVKKWMNDEDDDDGESSRASRVNRCQP